MGRKMEFRMERAGLIQVGDQVSLKEDSSSTMAGIIYYYTIRDAVAMSNNTKKRLAKQELFAPLRPEKATGPLQWR